jgi:hypothetical protein
VGGIEDVDVAAVGGNIGGNPADAVSSSIDQIDQRETCQVEGLDTAIAGIREVEAVGGDSDGGGLRESARLAASATDFRQIDEEARFGIEALDAIVGE